MRISSIAACTMSVMNGPVFLITGGGGYLGRRLVSVATTKGRVCSAVRRLSGSEVANVVVVDIANRDAVFAVVERLKPTAIVHAAAVNPGQGGEVEMLQVNADGSRHVAEAAVAVGARVVAVSTDIVHDGRAGPYVDDAIPTPINAYGRSKAAGEEAILEVDPSAVVARTSLMYGLDEMDRGTAAFAERLNRGEAVSLFSDVLRNPVSVDVLADALIRLTYTDYAGPLNVAGHQALSREEFGRKMLSYWGFESNDRIHSVRASDVSESIPTDLRLISSRAEKLLGMTFPGVDDVLSNAQTRPNHE